MSKFSPSPNRSWSNLLAAFLAFALSSAPSQAESAKEFLERLDYNGGTMEDFYAFHTKRTALLIDSRTGRGISTRSSEPVSNTRTDFIYHNPNKEPDSGPISVEEWSIKSNCAGGRKFIWLDSFRNDYPDSGKRLNFRIETTRAEIRTNGAWVDITDGGTCGTDGQPYALFDVTNDSYTLRVWGNLYKADGKTVGRRFFWQDTMSYVPVAANGCWKSDASTVRPAVKQEEAWWDSRSGWAFGSSGTMNSEGEPDGRVVDYGRWKLIAKGAGPGWQGGWFGPKPTSFCLR